MKRAFLLVLLVASGCASSMTITYHRVQLGSDERTLMVLVSKEKGLDGENPVALLDRLELHRGERYRANVGVIGDRAFAAITSEGGTLIVTDPQPAQALDDLLGEIDKLDAYRLGAMPNPDLIQAEEILEKLGAHRHTPAAPEGAFVPRPF